MARRRCSFYGTNKASWACVDLTVAKGDGRLLWEALKASYITAGPHWGFTPFISIHPKCANDGSGGGGGESCSSAQAARRKLDMEMPTFAGGI